MIKLFETFNEYNQVKEWLDTMGIKNYTINDDLTVDVNGEVNLNATKSKGNGLTEIPIQFGEIKGNFYIANNRLTSLVGSPRKIHGILNIVGNELTDLKDGPQYVGGRFYCAFNRLTSLEGCPEYVGGSFRCEENMITTLKYVPKYLNSGIVFHDNPLPREVIIFCYSSNDSKILFQYQNDYGIWNSDGSFNKGRWDIFWNDYGTGILNIEEDND